MYWLSLILNVLALAALFANHRLASLVCFLAYTGINLFFLLRVGGTDLDPVFFTMVILSSFAVCAALSAGTRDQVLTHQKKRGSVQLLIWSLVLAFLFGHWLLVLHEGTTAQASVQVVDEMLQNGEIFMLVAIVVLWLVGKNLYDRS